MGGQRCHQKAAPPALSAHLFIIQVFCSRPLWLSPSQVMVVPVGPTCEEYAQKVSNQAHSPEWISSDRFSPLVTIWKYVVVVCNRPVPPL